MITGSKVQKIEEVETAPKEKVVIIANTSWYIYNFRINLAIQLSTSGHEVIFIAPRDDYSTRLLAFGEYVELNFTSKSMSPIANMHLAFSIRKIIMAINPTFILAYTMKPNLFATLTAISTGVKVICNISGLGTIFIQQGIMAQLAVILYKVSLKYASHIFFQNLDDLALFKEQQILTQHIPVNVLPGSGVDTNKFSVSSSSGNNGLFTFLVISRMLWDKGIGEYVDAARKIKSMRPNVAFQLLGFLNVDNRTAISQSTMDSWCKEGLIEYLGAVDDVRPYIRSANIIVLPSYREGTPRSLLEAASMGKPIITTDTVGCKDVVDHGVNGYLVEAKNAEDLADKMLKMIDMDSAELDRMGKKSREKMVVEYDEKIVLRMYQKAMYSLS
jgi:glycosyltransferase involved in cell wall biosynthesis